MEDAFQGRTSWFDSLFLEVEIEQAIRCVPTYQRRDCLGNIIKHFIN